MLLAWLVGGMIAATGVLGGGVFDASVRENLGFARPDASDEELRRIVRAIAIRCLSPPENRKPRSPTKVS